MSYLHDSEAMNWPWVESPFFKQLNKNHSSLAAKFHVEGFAVLDLRLTDRQLGVLRDEVDRLNEEQIKTQDKGYHYSKGARIFEAWKHSEPLRKLSLNPKVFDALKHLYRRDPYPFQTITFSHGSNQPLHSDTIHFDSIPHRWLSAVWVALEDMREDNGPLIYVPGSHKLPIFDFYDLKIKVPKYGQQFDSYGEYEIFIQELVAAKQLQQKQFFAKSGWALIWAANLIHGGAPITNPDSTRYSHVTHYYYPPCDVYYSPMFSEAHKAHYEVKDIHKKNFWDVEL